MALWRSGVTSSGRQLIVFFDVPFFLWLHFSDEFFVLMHCSVVADRCHRSSAIDPNQSKWTIALSLSRWSSNQISLLNRFVKSFPSDTNTSKPGMLIGGSSLLTASIMDTLPQSDQNNGTGNLLPEMDIFSAGWALKPWHTIRTIY